MKKSKFVGTKSGDYTCIGIEVADVQPKYCRRKLTEDGKKAKTKSYHSQQYRYPYAKLTSDGKAIKHITLTAAQARKVYNGQATVDEYVKKMEQKKARMTVKKSVNYCFCD